jgi:hypothetical protein
LTNISVAYIQKEENFVADKIFPVVPVDKQSDVFFTYTKADWFRDEARPRAGGTESAGSGYGLSTSSYSCKVFALHKDIDDQIRQNSDAPLNPDRDATEFLTQRMLLRREKEFVTKFFASGIWGTDVTPTNLWSDYANSDPLVDIETGKRTILMNTGFLPNCLCLGYDVYRVLRNHPDIVDRIKYTSSETITKEVLAKLFDVEKIEVAMAVENTAVEGETPVMNFTHGKHALLCYTAKNPSIIVPSAGYIFSWKGVSSGLGYTIGTKKFRLEHLASDRIETEISFDQKVVGSDLGYFFANVVA